MTTEEKIEEIVIDAFNGWSKVGFTYEEMIAILSKLAEWKDEQVVQCLEEIMDNVVDGPDSTKVIHYSACISEITEKLFKK